MTHHTGSVPDTLEPPPAWSTQALCATPKYAGQHDLWFPRPSDEKSIRAARQICWDCPVIEACSQQAIANREPSGVWGGVDEKERRAILRRQGIRVDCTTDDDDGPVLVGGRPPAECGTRSAYSRHVKKKEPIDDACRQANADADNRLRWTGSTKAAA